MQTFPGLGGCFFFFPLLSVQVGGCKIGQWSLATCSCLVLPGRGGGDRDGCMEGGIGDGSMGHRSTQRGAIRDGCMEGVGGELGMGTHGFLFGEWEGFESLVWTLGGR